MTGITVMRAGLLTTVQDGGRWGHQAQGVPVSGPMDAFSMRLTNLLAGNREDEAALEVTLLGPELRFDRAAEAVVGGADLSASVERDAGLAPVTLWTPFRIRAGGSLRFGERRRLTRAYVAVRGGIDVPAVLGSRSTSVQARLPGLAGRALRAGDMLGIGDRAVRDPVRSATLEQSPWLPSANPAIVRFVWGPDDALFSADQRAAFVAATYFMSNSSNRMGYRLQGPRVRSARAATLLSEATPAGTIQVPPSGEPILLMADRQTTGGYPRIGTVITADMPLAGQLAPGDSIRFSPCGVDEAVVCLREREMLLRHLGGLA